MSNPYKYTDEEYTELLEGTRRFYDREEVVHVTVDQEWSKEETDYLFKTIEDYDSRFFIVHDRYEFPGGTPRSLEVRAVLRQDLGPPRSDLDQGPERQILQYLQKAREEPTLERRRTQQKQNSRIAVIRERCRDSYFRNRGVRLEDSYNIYRKGAHSKAIPP